MAALKADGALLLICEVEYFPPGSKIGVEQAIEAEPVEDFEEKSEVSLRESLKEMLDNELFADCTIKVSHFFFFFINDPLNALVSPRAALIFSRTLGFNAYGHIVKVF